MKIYYYNSYGKQKSIELEKPENVVAAEHNGKPIIKHMYRKNAASPERLGVFRNTEDRDNELANIRAAFEEGKEEYTIQNSTTEDVKMPIGGFFTPSARSSGR